MVTDLDEGAIEGGGIGADGIRERIQTGDRVVLEPLVGCEGKGFEPCKRCVDGRGLAYVPGDAAAWSWSDRPPSASMPWPATFPGPMTACW